MSNKIKVQDLLDRTELYRKNKFFREPVKSNLKGQEAIEHQKAFEKAINVLLERS